MSECEVTTSEQNAPTLAHDNQDAEVDPSNDKEVETRINEAFSSPIGVALNTNKEVESNNIEVNFRSVNEDSSNINEHISSVDTSSCNVDVESLTGDVSSINVNTDCTVDVDNKVSDDCGVGGDHICVERVGDGNGKEWGVDGGVGDSRGGGVDGGVCVDKDGVQIGDLSRESINKAFIEGNIQSKVVCDGKENTSPNIGEHKICNDNKDEEEEDIHVDNGFIQNTCNGNKEEEEDIQVDNGFQQNSCTDNKEEEDVKVDNGFQKPFQEERSTEDNLCKLKPGSSFHYDY